MNHTQCDFLDPKAIEVYAKQLEGKTSDHYPSIKHGIKFACANIGKTETITTFPYFCAFLLKRYLKGL